MISLYLRMLWLRIPLVGGMARLSKQQGLARKWDGTWREGELQLCHLFKGYLSDVHRDTFNHYLSYLAKSGDLGRAPAPVWLEGLLAVLVAVDAIALSLVLLPASMLGTTAELATAGVAGLTGLLLLHCMRQAGAQAYRNHVVRECRRQLPGGSAALLAGVEEVQAHRPQDDDDGDAPQVQRLRRVGTETGTQAIVVAVVLLLVVGGYSVLLHLKQQATEAASETAATEAAVGRAAAPPRAILLPTAAREAAKRADLFLGVLLLATLLVGASVGYRHHLAGKQSLAAYRATRGFTSYEQYVANGDGRVNHWADYWLKELQARGGQADLPAGGRTHHSFREFLFLTRQDDIKYDLHGIPHRAAKRDTSGARVESLLARIAELKHANRRAEAIALIQDLPEPEKSEVKARLSSQSAPQAEEVARRAAERQELEKIL